MPELKLNATLPEELLGLFLQHIRDFEARHFDQVLLVMAINAPEMKAARVEEIMRQIDPPFGHITTKEICPHCSETIEKGDVAIPMASGEHYHRECSVRIVVGSVAHQKRLCRCYGGEEEDPPDMTPRQAARAAWDYLNRCRSTE